MDLPRISVVTPSYNGAKYLGQCLDSMAAQDYPDLEVIIMDAGSTDATAELVAARPELGATFVSEPDEGQTDAIGKGFARATGDIYCWLNTDDMFEQGALAFVGRWFAEHPEADFLYGNVTWIDGESKVIKDKREIPFCRWLWIWGYNYLPQSSCFWRASLYERAGGMDKAFRLSMDADLFGRMLALSPPVHVDRYLSRFRLHADQRTWTERADMLAEDERIRERELGRKPGKLEWRVKHVLARGLRFLWRQWRHWTGPGRTA